LDTLHIQVAFLDAGYIKLLSEPFPRPTRRGDGIDECCGDRLGPKFEWVSIEDTGDVVLEKIADSMSNVGCNSSIQVKDLESYFG
jgi:hypothetical protein